jgi:hypothetical protein
MKENSTKNNQTEMSDLLIPDSFEGYKKAAKTIGLGIGILTSLLIVIKLGSIILADLKKSGL